MRRLTVAVAILAPIATVTLLFAHRPAAAAIVFIAGGVIVMTPVLRPNVQWLGPVITHFDTPGRELWLTIDDGPTDDTPALLDLLDRHGVTATFFVKGSLATRQAVDDVVRRGHTIGNHTQTHPSGSFWCLPPAAIAREIDACNAVIPPTSLFRAPVGMKNVFVHPLLAARGLHLIGFSARAFDAVVRDPIAIAAAIRRRLRPGAIVVLHQGRPWSLPAIEQTILRAREAGYEFVIPPVGRLKTKR